MCFVNKLDFFFVIKIKGTRFFGPANFNASLHCKDANVIRIKHNPGNWLIQQQQQQSSSEDFVEESDENKYRVELVSAELLNYFVFRT